MKNNQNSKFDKSSKIIRTMRTSESFKMMSKDLKKLQKSVKEKTDREIQSIIQLIDLPDFDVSEFFQTVLKSGHRDKVMKGIPQQKLIDFFSRNYSSFIQTQDQLSQLKLPILEEIPKAKTFFFEQKPQQKQQDNSDESSAIDIVDSFSSAVLQKNNEEILRILKMIKEMKNHSRYQQYFQNFKVSKLYRQTYEAFIETCDDTSLLVEIGQIANGLKKFLKTRISDLISTIRTDANIDNSNRGVKKIMNKLFTFIEEILREVNVKYPSQKFFNPLESDTIIPKFLSELCQEFYQVIQPCVYEKEELSEVLEALEIILESAVQLESKGVNISRQIRTLIAMDLPSHMNKIVEVVIESFEDILKDQDNLYEFKHFDGLSSLGTQLDLLHHIQSGQYGKKCCSQKGILLINAFSIILEPLCDQKWEFLLQNVIEQLMEKITIAISNSNWHFWDYYQLFYFFDRMHSGKIKNKRLFQGEEPPTALRDKFSALKKLSFECWENFQSKVTTDFWLKILSRIPDLLWEIRPYLEMKNTSSMKPTVFSIDLIFSMDDFLKQISYRLQKQQYHHLINRLYEYVMYMVEYILYWSYHQKGTNEKVFTLFKRSERTFKKAKLFSIESLQTIKQNKKITTISMLTKLGVQNIALDLYFFTQAMKMLTQYQKFHCEAQIEKIAQIQAKQHKNQAAKVDKQKFTAGIDKFMKILKEQPEKIRNYMINKRKQ